MCELVQDDLIPHMKICTCKIGVYAACTKYVMVVPESMIKPPFPLARMLKLLAG